MNTQVNSFAEMFVRVPAGMVSNAFFKWDIWRGKRDETFFVPNSSAFILCIAICTELE